MHTYLFYKTPRSKPLSIAFLINRKYGATSAVHVVKNFQINTFHKFESFNRIILAQRVWRCNLKYVVWICKMKYEIYSGEILTAIVPIY